MTIFNRNPKEWNFVLPHNPIFGNRNAWSRLHEINGSNGIRGILINSIWNNKITEGENGSFHYPLFTNNPAHTTLIENAVKNKIDILGALKRRTENNRNQYISSSCFFICRPKFTTNNKLDGFVITRVEGNISKIIGINNETNFVSYLENNPIILNTIRHVRERWIEGGENILQHNEIQNRLIAKLTTKFGPDNVRIENTITENKRPDVAVLENGRVSKIYEVKTGSTATGCIRAAIGQLLQYRYLLSTPEGGAPNELIAVGETVLTDAEKPFLEHLQALLRGAKPSIEFDYMSV